MAFELTWSAVPPQAFTADGTQFGVVTVADTAGFRVKQKAYLVATGFPPKELQVKRVLSSTQLIIGPVDNRIAANNFTNISAYTVAISSMIGAGEQSKNNIPEKDHYAAIYEADPVVADRVIQVDQYGNIYSKDNPMPIIFDGTVEIGQVEVIGENGNTIEPNSDGSINVNVVTTPVSGHTVKSIFNEITSVPSASQTQIVFYTVPPARTAVLQRIDSSGDNFARFDVYLNGVLFDTKRTWYGDFNSIFEFTTGTAEGFVLNAADVVSLKVTHDRPFLGSFTGRIQVLEIA